PRAASQRRTQPMDRRGGFPRGSSGAFAWTVSFFGMVRPPRRRKPMLRTTVRITAAVAVAFASFSAYAQQTVKIGMPLELSGQFADTANQMLNGVKTYMKMHGDTVAGKKIEIITKDVGGPAPDVAKRLSQELVVRDNVDILAGFAL